MRPRRPLSLLATAALAAPLLAGCGSSTSASSADAGGTEAAGFPASVERCDRRITVDAPPQRIASLNQGSTEILLSLGLADRMVGAAGWTDPILPSLADENEKVDRLADQAPSFEELLATEPDLVTASFANTLSEGGVATPQQLADVGVPAYLSAAECEKSDFGGGDGEGEDVVAAAGEEAGHARQHARHVLDQYGQCVPCHVSPPRPSPGSGPWPPGSRCSRRRRGPSATPWSP